MGFASAECQSRLAMVNLKKIQDKGTRKIIADKKKSEQAARSAHRKAKEAIKPLSKLKSEAQTAFNKYVRLRDYYEPCISCGKSKEEIEGGQGWKVGGCWDAGHFKTRGAKKQLRFILFNVHKQCKSCNGGSGKFSHKAATVDAQYEENLIKKIGKEKVVWLNDNNDIVRFDADYYRRIKMIFNKKALARQARLTLNQN
tara:strand:+ start:50185 stop:50781 length:597 start_codon:yes stop_codon:yes gene_type:complete